MRTSLLTYLVDWFFGYDFFISYKWSDGRSYASKLHKNLTSKKYHCFLDSEDYRKGENWKVSGRRALRKSSMMILVASPDAPYSPPVLEEIKYFSQNQKKHIIAIDIAETLSSLDNTCGLKTFFPDDNLSIREPHESLTLGPSEKTLSDIYSTKGLTKQETKRLRVTTGILLIITTLVFATTIGWINAKNQKEYAEKNLKISSSRMLALQAYKQKDKSMDLSLLLGAHAIETADTTDAQGVLLDILSTGVKKVLRGHDCCVTDVSFHPQSNTLASISADGKIIIWSAQNGDYTKQIQTIPNYYQMKYDNTSGTENRIEFFEDDKLLILFSLPNTLCCWNWKKQEMIWKHPISCTSFAFNHVVQNNKTNGIIAAAVESQKEILFLDPHTGNNIPNATPIILTKTPSCRAFDISSDGNVAVGIDKDIFIRKITSSSQPTILPQKHKAYVNVIRFSSNNTLASGGEDNNIYLWKRDSKENTWIYPDTPIIQHNSLISSLSFSPDNQFIYATSQTRPNGFSDNRLSQCDVNSKYATRFRAGHEQPVSDVAVSSDGRFVATSSWDGTIILWSSDLRRTHFEPFNSKDIKSIQFSPDGHLKVILSTTELVIHDETTNKKAITPITKETSGIEFDDEGKLYLVQNSTDSTDSTGKPGHDKIKKLEDQFSGLSIQRIVVPKEYDIRNGTILARVAPNGDIHIADMNQFQSISDNTPAEEMPVSRQSSSGREDYQVKTKHSDLLRDASDISIGPSGRYLAFSYPAQGNRTNDNDIYLWDILSSGDPTRILSGISDVQLIKFSESERYVFVSSGDKTIYMWDQKHSKISGINSKAMRNYARLCAFSHNEKLIAVVDQFGDRVKLLSSPSLVVIGNVKEANQEWLTNLLFSRDDQKLILWNPTSSLTVNVGKSELLNEVKKIVGRELSKSEWDQYVKFGEYKKVYKDLDTPERMHEEYVIWDFQI